MREQRYLIGPTNGVVTLFGYGISIRVDRGHLAFEDGIGSDRRLSRFPRVRHGLRRLVVIGSNGIVSLAALRWLADQDAAFVMLDRNGTVLATTGLVRPSDARLRRAQALANESGAALRIARELIGQKLVAQERVAQDGFNNLSAAKAIAGHREKLTKAGTIHSIRQLESQAAQVYWSGWNSLPINFPTQDASRVPAHWLTFGTRTSPLTGSPRLATNPPNAMLKYLYALLESEARLAITAMGLDPGLGMLHADTQSRDSLACDVMEPVRPEVDAYLLNWLRRERLTRKWFFEHRDGTCRLMAPLAVKLAQTAPIWARAVAPFVEGISGILWSTAKKPSRWFAPATRLTQRRRSKSSEGTSTRRPRTPEPPTLCITCGTTATAGFKYCLDCAVLAAKTNLIEAAKLGRVATHTPKAEALRAATQRRQQAARCAWEPSSLPPWLTRNIYLEKIQTQLSKITVSRLAATIGVSHPYATDIRRGLRVPHPRHWEKLAQLVEYRSNVL